MTPEPKSERSDEPREFRSPFGGVPSEELLRCKDPGSFKLHGSAEDREKQSSVIGKLRHLSGRINDHVNAANGLLFTGPCGSGKDHLALLMLSEWFRECYIRGKKRQDPSQAWVAERWTGGELRIATRESYGHHDGESSLVRQLTAPDVLLLSDPIPPSGEPLTPAQCEILQIVIDRRRRAGRSTWATLNIKDREEGYTLMSRPVFDRLLQSAVVVRCHWSSYRVESMEVID